MNKIETDILLIRKYLNGELDARAMHRLEKRAQDDPFLMDAIEGYEKAGKEQQEQLNTLTHRLLQRISGKERKIIPWNILAIAASVIVIFTIGGVWLFSGPTAKSPQVAQVIKPMVKPVADTPTHALPEKKNEQADLAPVSHHQKKSQKLTGETLEEVIPEGVATVTEPTANANIKAKKTDTAIKDTTPLNEMVVMEMVSPDKKPVNARTYSTSVVKLDTNPNKLLPAKVAGVTVSAAQGSSGNMNNLLLNKVLGGRLLSIGGRVIASDNGQPVPGASVRIAGTNAGAVTDADGRFSLRVDSNKKNKVVVAFIGYKVREISTTNRDSLKTIALEPSNRSLNEVAVTGYASQKQSSDNDVVIDAHPVEGWSSFKKYLADKAISPDSKTGLVKLSFMIDRYGTITDIKVTKGLSAATNQKAIDLIVNGPAWVGSTGGRTVKVRLRIKFDK